MMSSRFCKWQQIKWPFCILHVHFSWRPWLADLAQWLWLVWISWLSSWPIGVKVLVFDDVARKISPINWTMRKWWISILGFFFSKIFQAFWGLHGGFSGNRKLKGFPCFSHISFFFKFQSEKQLFLIHFAQKKLL